MKFRNLDHSAVSTNLEHAALGLPPLEHEVAHPGAHPALRAFAWLSVFCLVATLIYLGVRLLRYSGNLQQAGELIWSTLHEPTLWQAVVVGLLAQTVDGALGMAYGITSTTFLLVTGQTPAVASASVHIAEVFTTGVSGLAHIRMQNVDYKLFLRLLLPGITGALLGAYIVTEINGAQLKPWISAYLFLMGLYIVSKVFRPIRKRNEQHRHVGKLALAGGFVDAVGGGGWGPLVTTTLVGTGHDPRTTIGSVNFAEFFLTFGSACAFSVLVDETPWLIVAGLVIGGTFAAPFAAVLTRRFSTRTLLILVGALISLVSTYNLWRALKPWLGA